MVNLFIRRSIWRPSITDIYSVLTPSSRGDTISSRRHPFTIQWGSKPIRESCFVVVVCCWRAWSIDKRVQLVCFLEQSLGQSCLQVLRFIVCITVILRVWDYLVSDPAKQVLERHEKRDRREDGTAVWTNEMTFRQQTDWKVTKGRRISYLKYFRDRFNPKFNYYLNSRDSKPVRSALKLATFAYWHI